MFCLVLIHYTEVITYFQAFILLLIHMMILLKSRLNSLCNIITFYLCNILIAKWIKFIVCNSGGNNLCYNFSHVINVVCRERGPRPPTLWCPPSAISAMNWQTLPSLQAQPCQNFSVCSKFQLYIHHFQWILINFSWHYRGLNINADVAIQDCFD